MTDEEHVFEPMLGKRIEMVFYDEGTLHIKIETGQVYMFRWEEDGSLIIEVYKFGTQ